MMPPSGTKITVTIIIKALNEAQRIGACIESALAALGDREGEVILADSGSTDGTLEIATRYPIRIVQPANPSIGRCGIGPQLGFQFAGGKFVYILDGDMELHRNFLDSAIRELDANPNLAGVAGLVEEASEANVQFRARKSRAREGRAGTARWLDMGGLYRASALRCVGYMSNRNLHACEEQELGLRLTAAGWQLRRLPVPGVTHYGHTDDSLSLQMKRLRSGYLYGPGEILRSSIGRPYFLTVAGVHRHLIGTLALWCLFVAGLIMLPASGIILLTWVGLMAALILQRITRQGNVRDALAVTLLWHINALALARGFFSAQTDPTAPIDAIVIADGHIPRGARGEARIAHHGG